MGKNNDIQQVQAISTRDAKVLSVVYIHVQKSLRQEARRDRKSGGPDDYRSGQAGGSDSGGGATEGRAGGDGGGPGDCLSEGGGGEQEDLETAYQRTKEVRD